MSARPVLNRAGTQCLFCKPLAIRPHGSIPVVTRRAASDDAGPPKKTNPVLEEYLRKNPRARQRAAQAAPATGDISPSSIFEDAQQTTSLYEQAPTLGEDGKLDAAGKPRDPENIRRFLDVKPASRVRWERRKVIQMVQKEGQLTKQEMIKRTEREHLIKSHMLKTSVKKLGMLARQISGKTLADAITQMRFSKKKMAVEVLKQLERARDEAVVMRGMGLPLIGTSESGEMVTTSETPVDIQLKNGSRYTVKDPSTIYIAQAWVGRGTFGQLPDFRARGRLYIMRTPWTSLSVILKEDTTRIREHQEREAKRRQEKVLNPWVHLPDRPIPWQRQWYTF